MRARFPLLIAFIILICIFACGLFEPKENYARKYATSLVVGSEKYDESWTEEINVSTGTLILSGVAKPHGKADITFWDEKVPRIIYNHPDYLYIRQIRLAPDESLLFLKVRGILKEIWPSTWVIIYDLRKRQVIIAIKEEDLLTGKY